MANHPEMPMYVHATADLHLVTPKNSIKRPSSPRRKSKKATKWLKKKSLSETDVKVFLACLR